MRVNFKGACVGGFKRIGHVRLIALLDFVYAAFFLSLPPSLLIPAPRGLSQKNASIILIRITTPLATAILRVK
jgi:hypothetical protein